MAKYLTLAEAQQQLLNLPNQLIHQPAILTTEGKPVMIALSVSQFESLFAMVELLSQSQTELSLFQPQLTLIYQTMGVILQMQGQLEKAKHYYHQALEYQPNCAEVYANLGSLYATQQQWEQAIASYQSALQFKPSLAGVYRNLAQIWQIKNQPQKVTDCQYSAFLLEPERVSLEDYLKLGQTLLKQSQLEKVIQLYSQAVKLYPKSAKIYYFFGKVLSQTEQWEAACLNYENAIQLNPDANHYYNSLGDALTRLQKWEQAIDNYLKGIQVAPDICWSYFKLADAYMECQQWENAIKTYRQGLKLNPDNYWPYIKMGDAFLELNQIEEAIAIYQKAQDLNQNLENSYYKLADLFKENNRYNEAIIQYNKTLEINPNLLFIYEDLGDVLQEQKRWQEAVELYKKAIQFNPGIYRLYFKLGVVFQHKKNWDAAIDAFMKTIELKTDCFDAYNELAYIFECQGYPETAIACLHYKLLPPIVIQTFCEYPQEQVVSLESAADVTTIHLYPEHQKKCLPPITLDGTVEDCFQHDYFTSSAAFVSILPNGKALADPILTSAVLNSKSQLIPELSSGHPEFLISSNHPYSLHEIDETIAFLSVRWGNGGYFHWMFDVVARLHLVQRVSQSQNIKIDKFVFSHCPNQSQIDCLEALGVASEQILESFEYPYLKAKQVIVPNIVQEFGISEWKCHYLKEAFLNQEIPPKIPGYRRIYIDRNQANYRKVLNNEQVVQLLEQYGFQRLYLENLSVVEQAYYLNAAEVVLAPHGAGLTNLVFCDSRTKVIEIFSPGYITPLYWFLSTICQLEHYYLLGERLPEDDDPKINPVTRDIWVNLHQLEQLLKKAGL